MSIKLKQYHYDEMLDRLNLISNIIETQYQRAINLLKKHKNKLVELADFLLDKEVIFKEDLLRIYGERPFDIKNPK